MEFHNVLLEDKPIIDAYFKPLQPECSEFTFTNLIMWGQDGKIKWAQQDDVLYIRLQFGAQHAPFFFPPIPKDMSMDYRKAIDAAANNLIGLGETPKFRSVNGAFVPLFQRYAPDYRLTPDRNTFDYVYRAESLITLRGKKLHAKRNHINQFRASFSHEYRPLTPDMAEECLAVYLKWLEGKDVFEPGILGEMKAIKFLLPNMEALGVQGGTVYVDGKLVAFTVGEPLRHDMAVIHIEKADPAYPGLYAVINQQFAEHAWSNMTYINREEDMGIEGMRKAKLSYYPVRLTEKFDAVPAK